MTPDWIVCFACISSYSIHYINFMSMTRLLAPIERSTRYMLMPPFVLDTLNMFYIDWLQLEPKFVCESCSSHTSHRSDLSLSRAIHPYQFLPPPTTNPSCSQMHITNKSQVSKYCSSVPELPSIQARRTSDLVVRSRGDRPWSIPARQLSSPPQRLALCSTQSMPSRELTIMRWHSRHLQRRL